MSQEYTTKQRRDIAAAFRACLPHIYPGIGEWRVNHHSAYICHALDANLSPGTLLAEGVVMDRLAGYRTVDVWLRLVAKIPERQLTCANVQAHRIAWVKKLIEEFES